MSIISKDKNIPLICRGHSRLVSYLEHSQVFKGDACYLLSACVGKYINLSTFYFHDIHLSFLFKMEKLIYEMQRQEIG